MLRKALWASDIFVVFAAVTDPVEAKLLPSWHARPYAFEQTYDASAGIGQFLCGIQPILSMRALKGALIWEQVGLQIFRQKSIALTDLFIDLVEAKCVDYGFELESKRNSQKRGSQVSFSHANSYEIM